MRRRFREEIASSPTVKTTARHRRDGLPATDGPRRAEPLVGSRDDVQPPKRRVSTRPRRSAAARPGARARLEFGPAPGSGGEARFGLGLEWAAEPADRPGRQAPASTDEAPSNL